MIEYEYSCMFFKSPHNAFKCIHATITVLKRHIIVWFAVVSFFQWFFKF